MTDETHVHSTSMTADVGFLELVVRFETTLWNVVDDDLAREGASSLATLLSLRSLAQEGGRGRVQDLATSLDVTIGAASKIVDRLERDGLARRRPHPEDRRSSLIALTEAGDEALDKATAIVNRTLAARFPSSGVIVDLVRAVQELQSDLHVAREGASE